MPRHQKVSFVVPCYKLAHFLEECVRSIVEQSYQDIEIIILDDQSPDNTSEVSRNLIAAYPTREISYVLNPLNLGNIANYNKGINASLGKYVWILSPDDRLRDQNAVERYVDVMESDPSIGYVFSSAHTIEDGVDVGPLPRSIYRDSDGVFEGRTVVKEIIGNKFDLIAASVMIRKACYEHVTMFPQDMPHRGDSYVWSLIAMNHRVGFIANAMVDYRVHSGSMASTFMRDNMGRAMEDDISVPWRVKAVAEKEGAGDVIDHCWLAILQCYKNAALGISCRGYFHRFALAEIETSLARWEVNPLIRDRIRMVLAGRLYRNGVGSLCRGNLSKARHAFKLAFSMNPKLSYGIPISQLVDIDRLDRQACALLRAV